MYLPDGRYTLLYINIMNRLRLLIGCVSIFVSVIASAQGRYSLRLMDEGNMVFFYPCKLASLQKGRSLVYDMNYITGRDSVVVNMTFSAPCSDVETVKLMAGDSLYETTDFTVFYREREKKNIASRIHILCPKDIYEAFFRSDKPLVVEVTTKSCSVSRFSYKPSTWKKERAIVHEAIELAK